MAALPECVRAALELVEATDALPGVELPEDATGESDAPQDKGPGAPKSGAPKWGDDGGVGDDSFEVYLNPGALKQGDINSFAGDFVTWTPEREDPSRRLNSTKITDLLELIDKDISCVKVIACPPEISLRRVSSIAR